MIVAIICLTLTSAMAVSLVRLALVSHQQAERDGWRMQSVWLAESGLARAAARLRENAGYRGEQWTPSDIGAVGENGTVLITVAAAGDDHAKLTITATADFPDHPTDRVRTTRTLTITRGDETDAPPSSEDQE